MMIHDTTTNNKNDTEKQFSLYLLLITRRPEYLFLGQISDNSKIALNYKPQNKINQCSCKSHTLLYR